MDAGKLDRRLVFEKRIEQSDGFGNTVRPEYVPQFTTRGNRHWLRGGESVMAARLESRQPAILTVRNSEQARSVTNDWRVRDTGDGRTYNVRSLPNQTQSRHFLEILVESGVAP